MVVTLVALGSISSTGRGAQDSVDADFYVATDGKDTNPGTRIAPFATLSKARDAVRERIAAGLVKDLLVLIRGGVHEQMDTIRFGPEDSATQEHSITYSAYPGEKVLLSGGRRITRWKKGPGKVWTAELPQVKAGDWYFRQLFVDGRRATRARTPNADDKIPWWIIKSSTLNHEEKQDESQPFVVRLNNPIRSYQNPGDVELVCIYNNEGGRKRLKSVNEAQQTLTIAAPHKWNPRVFGNDWYLCAPTTGKACYLENASEMLDQPGEWYLDRKTGILSYWPRPGEDLSELDVVAPVVQNTLLAVVGSRERPVVNVHFKGIRVEHVDWPLPPWGYNGLFCCNVAVFGGEQPGHRFIEAAVEFEHARSCNFVEGGIASVGGMGLCLRDGTAHNIIEGNELADLGGGAIGAGGCNVAGGHLYAASPPVAGDFVGYRIANNYVHHCGRVYYGGSGICLYLAQEAVVSHNLIHDTAYFGICVAASQDPEVKFAKNNTVEYNHIYNAMQVTVDGSAMYVTFANYGEGTLIRGNLIHDTQFNKFGRGDVPSGIRDTIPCHGLYLDGNSTGCTYDHNVVYNNAGGPLLFNSHKSNNTWTDNLFQKAGKPPQEFIEAMQAYAGLQPAYRKSILNEPGISCTFKSLLEDPSDEWAAYQIDRSDGELGVVEVMQRASSIGGSLVVKLRHLDVTKDYMLKGYSGKLAPADKSFFEGTFFGDSDPNLFTRYMAALDDLPILTNVRQHRLSVGRSVGGGAVVSGRELVEQGLETKPEKGSRVTWIAYKRLE
jgi:hypothetical protein